MASESLFLVERNLALQHTRLSTSQSVLHDLALSRFAITSKLNKTEGGRHRKWEFTQFLYQERTHLSSLASTKVLQNGVKTEPFANAS